MASDTLKAFLWYLKLHFSRDSGQMPLGYTPSINVGHGLPNCSSKSLRDM